MTTRSHTATHTPAGRARARVAGLCLAAAILSGCGGVNSLPAPRPLIVSSGARLTAEPDRMQTIYDWVMNQDMEIREDPTFLIESIPTEQDPYPWETLVIQGDTARFRYNRANEDIQTPYQFYAHFYLMRSMGRLAQWLPEAPAAEGYELERVIVARMADSWLLGRAIFDAQPHAGLDELIYAKEAGHLDAFLFTSRPDAFPEARDAWILENPGRMEAYREWFRNTFNGDPPGGRGSGPD